MCRSTFGFLTHACTGFQPFLLLNCLNVRIYPCWQLEAVREEEMVAEAATVEAVWVVEPPLLEDLLDQEVSAFCSETVSFPVAP